MSKQLLINFQNEDNECFFWLHIGYLNPIKKNENTEQINKSDKGISVSIDYKDIIFSFLKKSYYKIESKLIPVLIYLL